MLAVVLLKCNAMIYPKLLKLDYYAKKQELKLNNVKHFKSIFFKKVRNRVHNDSLNLHDTAT